MSAVQHVSSSTITMRKQYEKKPDSFESGLRYWPREADTITFQEGLPSPRVTGGGGQCAPRNLSVRDYDPRGCLAASTQAACQSCGDRGLLYLTRFLHANRCPPRVTCGAGPASRAGQAFAAKRGCETCRSRRPALRLAHHEVAEHLDARHRLQLFRIDEVGIELDRVGFAEQLHQAVVFLDQIVRQCCDAEALLAGAHQAEDFVDLEVGFARTGAVAAGLDQPVAILQMRRDLAVAQRDDAVRVEFVEGARRAETLDVFRRAIGVEAHREQLALDQVGLGRLAGADRDVGLAHRQVELLVGDDQRNPDLRIKGGEFAKPGDQPVDADAGRGRDLEIAARPLAAVGQFGARCLQLHEHAMGGAEQQVALLGENEAARVAMEQRHRQFLLQRADLPGNRRLRQTELLAGIGEAPTSRRGVKPLQFLPIHIGKSVAGSSHDYSAAARSLARSARKRSASRAAMQPRPAAVTACRQVSSATSPAANTPGTEVAVEFGATSTYPDGLSLIWPWISSVAGAWPIAMKTPSAGNSVSVPDLTFFNRTWVTLG